MPYLGLHRAGLTNTGVVYDPDARAYFDAVASAGGAISVSAKSAVNSFVTALRAQGIWSKILDCGLFAGVDFTGACVKLKSYTTSRAYTVEGFTSSHYSPTLGLLGSTGRSLDTGFTGSSLLAQGDAHLSCYNRTAVSDPGAFPAFMGAWSGSGLAECSLIAYQGSSATAGYAAFENAATTFIEDSAARTVGFFSGSALGGLISFYFNGERTGQTTPTYTKVLPVESLTVFARRGAGGIGNRCNARLAFYSIGTGLTDADETNLASAVATLTAKCFANVFPSTDAYCGTYLLPHFVDDGGGEILKLTQSGDGATFAPLSCSYTPSLGSVRDPSPLIADGFWWIAHTTGAFGDSTSFGVAKADPVTRSFTTVANVDCSSVSGVNRVWGAKWFVDPLDDSRHIVCAISADGSDGPFVLYELHPTNAAMTTWSAPVLITGTSLPSNMIDAMWFTTGDGFYYILVKDESKGTDVTNATILRSSSLTSGYAVHKSHTDLNWGPGIEGYSIIDDGADYLVFGDFYAADTGMHWARASKSDFTLTTGWTAVNATTPTRNGMCIKAA